MLQLFAIGESVTAMRAQLVELGGALIEAEHKRLATRLRELELRHAALVEAVHKNPPEH